MKLTVFTPVYNRADIIDGLYESLTRQTNKDFIWLVIDDGSTDNIRKIIGDYQKDSPFEIRYVYQKNQGKHAAHNAAVSACETELFFCVDSDDTLTEDAVEKIYETDRLHKDENILGYYFRKADENGEISGGEINLKTNKIGLRDIYYKCGFIGELAIVFKAEKIKNYSFPVFENEKFVSEKVFYNQLNCIAPMVFSNDIIYIFEYQEDGYTRSAEKLAVKNPNGCAYGYLSDAFYGCNIISRSKAYAAFLGMKKIFCLKSKILFDESRKLPWNIKILGTVLKFHYIKLFAVIKNKYISEE